MKSCGQIEASHQVIKKLESFIENQHNADVVEKPTFFECFFVIIKYSKPAQREQTLFSIGSDISKIRSILGEIKQEELKIFNNTSTKVDNNQRSEVRDKLKALIHQLEEVKQIAETIAQFAEDFQVPSQSK